MPFDALRQLVDQNMALYLFDDAIFYAERLYCESHSPEHLNLIAQCFFKQGKMKQTYLLLQFSEYHPNRYLFALTCISLGKFKEAEKSLLPTLETDNFDPEDVPGGAAGLYLLGIICRRENRRESAVRFFKLSLQVRVQTDKSTTTLF